jgi:thiamine biosynthesis lipoprotein
MTPRTALTMLLLALATLASSCSGLEPGRYEFSEPKMGTEFRLVLYARSPEQAQRAARRAFERVEELEACMSDYRAESELMQLSSYAASDEWAPVSEDLGRVLTASQAISESSSGAFDVTVGPLVRLWRRARRQERAPAPEAIDEALGAVGYRKLLLAESGRAVRLVAPGMRLDLGGIAKGYALDEALEALRAEGIEAALVDGGGDVRVGAAPPGRDAWRVRVDSGGEPLWIELVESAVATSGDAYRFVELEGVRYSHIIDPRSGRALAQQATASVIARDGMSADALASAASVLGPSEGLAWLRDVDGVEARWVWLENDLLRSCETPGLGRKMAAAPGPSEISTRSSESP